MEASLVKVLIDGKAQQTLYRVSPPLEGAEYVVVSAVVAAFSGPETYIFRSDADGRVVDYGELRGSYRGGLDHKQALAGAGYHVKD